MKIKLLSPRGFCAGVNRATAALNEALKKYGTPVYVYHEIVHNKWVVEFFRQRGAIFISSLDEAPDGSVLLFSAHGISPEIEAQAKRKNLRYIDASCPLVKKVHHEAKQFVEQGYRVVLIGHPHHDEVVGVEGEAPNKIFVAESIEAIDKLPFTTDERIAYITQTTLSLDEVSKTIEYLKSKCPNIIGPSAKDICYATQNRQRAIKMACSEFVKANKNLVVKALVVGSANSSNSIRLKEIAQREGVQTCLIDGPEDIRSDDFAHTDVILLTAGASAHESVVQMVVEYFRTHFNAQVEEFQLCEENTVFQLPVLP